MATILIVDDEAHIRLLLEQTLEDLEDDGVEIITAGDGAAGVAAIAEHRPDLVFLDVMMPKMNGFEVCQEVKGRGAAIDGGPVPYIVLLTAKGQDSDRHVGLDSGADMFATKPFDPDEVIDIARRVLNLPAD